MIPSKTVFLLPCKVGHYIKPLQSLQYPREQYSIPTPITNLRVSFISLHKLLRQGRAPLWLISRFPVCIFLLTAFISFDCIIEELEETQALRCSDCIFFLEVVIN